MISRFGRSANQVATGIPGDSDPVWAGFLAVASEVHAREKPAGLNMRTVEPPT